MVIFYRAVSFQTVHAQVRRIICDACKKPFSYVIGDFEQTQTNGFPGFSDDDGMREEAFEMGLKKLARLARKEHRGEARCPHCDVYQQFMVRASLVKHLGWGIGIGLVFGGMGTSILGGAGFVFPVGLIPAVVGATMLCILIGGVIGKMCALSTGPHQGNKDARSMTDEQFVQHLEESARVDLHPAMAWFFLLGYGHDPNWRMISLGIDDKTPTPLAPHELSTDHILDQLDNWAC